MATSSSSGKSSSFSKPDTASWELLESGAVAWEDMGAVDRRHVVQHYAPKIKFLALRLKAKLPQNVELNDIISSGTLGLMEALGKYDPRLGIKFETYAENRIRGAMLDELRRMDWFSRGLRQRVRALEDASKQYENRHGKKASEEELMQMTGLSAKEVRIGLEALKNQLCLDIDSIRETFSAEGKGQAGDEPYHTTALQEVVDKVAGLIEELTPREKMVMSLYYGDELTMRETAEVMDITEGRVSQLHSQAMARLRQLFRERYGADFTL
ncbi:MAG: FliA/WhiG family RNA polymerase sigma factor [Oceanidesulfovibrio sp.]